MQLDQRQAKKCAVIEVEPNEFEGEEAHIIKRSLAKEGGSETGIVSIGLVCHSVTSMQKHSQSFPPTWDIIHQYANIAVEILEKALIARKMEFSCKLRCVLPLNALIGVLSQL